MLVSSESVSRLLCSQTGGDVKYTAAAEHKAAAEPCLRSMAKFAEGFSKGEQDCCTVVLSLTLGSLTPSSKQPALIPFNLLTKMKAGTVAVGVFATAPSAVVESN